MPKLKKYLDRTRERELIAQYQEDNDGGALEELIEAHSAYIQKIATKEYIKFGKIVEYEDLIQEGKIGLIKAIKKFDINRTSINPNDNTTVKNQALLTYAHSWILSEMQNLFHRSHPAHIPAHTLRAIYFKVKNPGCNTESRKALAKQSMRAESLDNVKSDIEMHAIPDKYEFKIMQGNVNTDPTFQEVVKHIYSPRVQGVIKKLTPLEWKIISMRYGLDEGLTAKTHLIAKELNISVEEVDKNLKRAKRILFKNLQPEMVAQ